MKKMLWAITLAVLFMMTSNAYSGRDVPDCGPAPKRPVVPYGPTAERWQIEATIDRVKEYNLQMKEYIQCLQELLKHHITMYNEVNSELTDAVEAINNREGVQ
ncbi:MAG: hypothetical protein ACOWYE_01860 [Desulfatiglandales bacterium]